MKDDGTGLALGVVALIGIGGLAARKKHPRRGARAVHVFRNVAVRVDVESDGEAWGALYTGDPKKGGRYYDVAGPVVPVMGESERELAARLYEEHMGHPPAELEPTTKPRPRGPRPGRARERVRPVRSTDVDNGRRWFGRLTLSQQLDVAHALSEDRFFWGDHFEVEPTAGFLQGVREAAEDWRRRF